MNWYIKLCLIGIIVLFTGQAFAKDEIIIKEPPLTLSLSQEYTFKKYHLCSCLTEKDEKPIYSFRSTRGGDYKKLEEIPFLPYFRATTKDSSLEGVLLGQSGAVLFRARF